MKDIELSKESKQRILEAQKRDALRNELNKNNYSNNYQKTSVSKQRVHKEKKKSAIGSVAIYSVIGVTSFLHGLWKGLNKPKSR